MELLIIIFIISLVIYFFKSGKLASNYQPQPKIDPNILMEIEEAKKEIASCHSSRCLSGDCYDVSGTHISPRAKYVGEFKFGVPHGVGKAVWADGLMISGSFQNGSALWGEIFRPNGEKYEGQIEENFYHGKGTLKYPNGESLTGWFEKGKFIGTNRPPSIAELKKMDYASYLLTDHWAQVRGLALEQHGKKCAFCGERGHFSPLQVHHNSYEHRGYEEEHLEDLQVLCKECHERVHQINH